MVLACDGLDYAHWRNVVHRDIKPANMILPKDGGLKIVDFGIARVGNERFTRTGQVMGSIYYMSPEQINGEIQVPLRTGNAKTEALADETRAPGIEAPKRN